MNVLELQKNNRNRLPVPPSHEIIIFELYPACWDLVTSVFRIIIIESHVLFCNLLRIGRGGQSACAEPLADQAISTGTPLRRRRLPSGSLEEFLVN